MTRRTRNLQFFASGEEAGLISEDCWSLGLCVHAVEDDRTSRLERSTMPKPTVRRVLVGEADEIPDDAHRQPARYGMVVVDLPCRVDGELRMAILGAVNVWSIDGEGFEDDWSRKMFDVVKKVLRVRLTGSVFVVSRSTGAGQHYPAIRSTDAAVADWHQGVSWAQDGVAGLEYRPYDVDRVT